MEKLGINKLNSHQFWLVNRLAGGDVDPLLLLKKSYPQYFEKRQKRTAQQIFDDAFQGLDDELD